MLVWIGTDGAPMGLPDGILRATDVERLLDWDEARRRLDEQAGALLAEAEQMAEQMLAQARADAEALLAQTQQRVEEAERAGYKQGEQRCVSEWHERRAEEARAQEQSVRRMHEKLAGIVTTAVERIVHTDQREALYQRSLRCVRSLTQGASNLTLRVGLDDLEAAQQCAGEWRLGDSGGIRLEVVADAGLRPGSCIFESELGVLDASLETQLEGLRAAMKRAVGKALLEAEDVAGAQPDGEPQATESEMGDEEEDGDEYEDIDETDDWHANPPEAQ